MSDCVIKSFGGCACRDGECAEKHFTPAPLIAFSWRDHLAACLTVGVIAGILAFAVAYRAEPYFKKLDLIAQESRHG